MFLALSIMGAVVIAGCGGGSSSSPTTPTGEASVDALSNIPSLDLSEYDSSSGGNANLAVPPKSVSKSVAKAIEKDVAKAFGEGMRDVGGNSRAGCEANMHKKEIFRMSQQVQLDRCYPEAMEKAGFITIPNDVYAYYRIAPPEMDETQQQNMCEGIPADQAQEKAKCLEEAQKGPGGGNMLMRIGRMAGALHVDMCQGDDGTEALVNESTYSANGSIYTVATTHIGSWNGNQEGGKFDIVLDLGTTGKVEDSVATLGTDSSLDAEGYMSGGFGSGHIKFQYVGTDASNKIIGGFKGGFTDPTTNTASSFTGKTYARFGGSSSTGCAKYSFTGTMPGMPASMMLPYDISANDAANFYNVLSTELGFMVTANTVLCPNPIFDPDNCDPLIKPMIGTVNGACPEVTNTGVECFSIANVASTGSFGGTEYTQLFTIIASSGSPYYDEVNAADVSTIVSDSGTIAFSRNWDCSGTFTLVDFQAMTPEQGAIAQTAIQACKAIEEEARANQGMGGYDCGQQEQGNAVNEIANEGGGVEAVGKYGGKYRLSSGCQFDPAPIPPDVFVNEFNNAESKYCVPVAGACVIFTVVGEDNPIDPPISLTPELAITNILYDPSDPPVSADLTWDYVSGSCTATYLIERPEFQREGTGFVDQANCTGEQCQQGMPQACKDAGLTSPAACEQLCKQASNPCSIGG